MPWPIPRRHENPPTICGRNRSTRKCYWSRHSICAAELPLFVEHIYMVRLQAYAAVPPLDNAGHDCYCFEIVPTRPHDATDLRYLFLNASAIHLSSLSGPEIVKSSPCTKVPTFLALCAEIHVFGGNIILEATRDVLSFASVYPDSFPAESTCQFLVGTV